jgi:hypothetical protein
MTTVSVYEDPISSEMAEASEVFTGVTEWSLIEGGFLLLEGDGWTNLINVSRYATVHFDEHLEWEDEDEEGDEDDDDGPIESPFY